MEDTEEIQRFVARKMIDTEAYDDIVDKIEEEKALKDEEKLTTKEFVTHARAILVGIKNENTSKEHR
ncbi:hypothetical protein N7508_001435 [Penicillium antarcticum]|uniref:uncharacterized protein n=1 Tax=Penicillium antarcticum TaxID=416450 RepID=UPI0023A319BB|nr:uncharacterized protein N7508_001435 [Penicillium antarcticum]KAJ5316927.1 hypothetical protein N7508_001435 [Penicillium antarcticum]